jgi:hypothetical protein
VTAVDESEKINDFNVKQMAAAVRMGHHADPDEWRQFLDGS